MKQDILVPFDGSDNAKEALRLAIDIAKAFGEKVILLNVQPSYETPHTKRFFGQCQIEEFRDQMAEEALQPGKEILEGAGVGFTVKALVGDPREEICKEAMGGRDEDPEAAACSTTGVRLIVMGSRGLNAILGSVMGSVSMGVLHNAPCPITIVPYSC